MNQYIRNIVDHLLFHSSYLNNVGFFHGKMGIVVAMYAYANRYKDKFIEEYAWDLLQDVYDGIHADMPIGIESGLQTFCTCTYREICYTTRIALHNFRINIR